MGWDCGFDIYPRLEATATNKLTYQRFLDEIIDTYEDVFDGEGRREDGKVLLTSTDPDNDDRAYVQFMVGEVSSMPSNPDHCNYFLRFSSKVSGRLSAPAEPYIRSVHKIAKKYFGSRVHWWNEMNETGDARQFGCYGWQEIHGAREELKALETTHKRDGENKVGPTETKSTGPQAAPAGVGHSTPVTASQAPLLCAVRTILGKGQGLIATSKIPKGTRILSEAPLFKVPRNQPSHKALDAHITKELKRLDKDQQRAYFALHNAHGRDHSPFLGIARTNVLPLGSQALEGGLFLEASRINHSCRPNAQNTWNSNTGRLTIHAIRDIEEGEEISITYLSHTTEYANRQRFLKGSFFFDCGCELCILPAAERRESDRRLREIQSIDDKLGFMGSGMVDYGKGLHLLRSMFRLFEEEGIWDASIPRAYYDAFQIACMFGDGTRAKIFAERAFTARAVIEGDDSVTVARLKRFAEDPSQHGSYQLLANSPRGVRPPQERDGLKVDNWLWG